jgi:redox-sensing transcriptional repressor
MLNPVPDIVIHRLPLYLRVLENMVENNHLVTSSQELGVLLGISSAQIRKDLSHFGEFGKQGTGYEVHYLRDQLQRILQVDQVWSVVVVGAGDLGHALVKYGDFRDRNFEVEAIFDIEPAKIGTRIGDLVVEDQSGMPGRVADLGIKIGIIAVPAKAAQRVAELLVEGGVRAILNYAPITLNLPPEIRVEYIDPVTALQTMTYYLQRDPVREQVGSHR